MNAFVVGAGRLGTALARALPPAGVTVLGTWSRTPAAARRARAKTGLPASSGRFPRAVADADLVLLTVRDDAVAEVCAALTESGRIRPGQLVIHCAGALDLSPLTAAAGAGAATGSLHPLQAFVGDGPPRFEGALALLDGPEAALAVLEPLARALGMRPATLGADGSRTLYHAAAVLSAGHLVALLDAALQAAEAAGLSRDEARAGLSHLARGTLEHLAGRGCAEALTGPVARGDAGVVRAHLAALSGVDGLAEVYRVLAARAVEVAARGDTPAEGLQAVTAALRVRAARRR